MKKAIRTDQAVEIPKVPTGIAGLDEITRGGLPEGRPTLICGGPGCGKTIMAMEFLIRGAREAGEPGLLLSLEERQEDLLQNFRPFCHDLDDLIEQGKLMISHVDLAEAEIFEGGGTFSLEPLMLRLEAGIKKIGAKRLAIDTLETIFQTLSDRNHLRREISSFFHWLRSRGITSVITAEAGERGLTRYDFEAYLSDCVLFLDHRIQNQLAKRRIRVLKYRGSSHGTDEYPFLIAQKGITVMPITSLRLEHEATTRRVSTGVEDLDEMFEGQGYFEGTSVLITGRAGTGKSTLAAAFVASAAERSESCLYFAFEESASQITRNMKSVGIDLEPWIEDGTLEIHAFRPTVFGLEEHLLSLFRIAEEREPRCVVIDPITNFASVGSQEEVKAMLTRLVDHMKRRQITTLVTALTPGSGTPQDTETAVSSLMDTWIALTYGRSRRKRRRELFVIKSRGMDHSHETREFVISKEGVSLLEIGTGQESASREDESRVQN